MNVKCVKEPTGGAEGWFFKDDGLKVGGVYEIVVDECESYRLKGKKWWHYKEYFGPVPDPKEKGDNLCLVSKILWE